MSRTLNDLMASLPEERRQHIEARAATLLEQEILRQLRKTLGLSQKDLAGLMHITQPAVSKLERQTDMQLSTLAGIVQAMGGTLEITARFPDREPVRLA
ncbi:MAG: XRE family transcriptional regulator [Lancefieldella rimae]